MRGCTFKKGITAFRKLKSPDKKRIGGLPTLLLVPPELQFVAQRLYQSTTIDPGSGNPTGTANIHAGQLGASAVEGVFDVPVEGADHLRSQPLAGFPQARCVEVHNEPVDALEHLDELRQFTGVLTLTYRVWR